MSITYVFAFFTFSYYFEIFLRYDEIHCVSNIITYRTTSPRMNTVPRTTRMALQGSWPRPSLPMKLHHTRLTNA